MRMEPHTIHHRYMKVSDWRNIRGVTVDSHELKIFNVTRSFAKSSRYSPPLLLPGNGAYWAPEIESSTMAFAVDRFNIDDKQKIGDYTNRSKRQAEPPALPARMLV